MATASNMPKSKIIGSISISPKQKLEKDELFESALNRKKPFKLSSPHSLFGGLTKLSPGDVHRGYTPRPLGLLPHKKKRDLWNNLGVLIHNTNHRSENRISIGSFADGEPCTDNSSQPHPRVKIKVTQHSSVPPLDADDDPEYLNTLALCDLKGYNSQANKEARLHKPLEDSFWPHISFSRQPRSVRYNAALSRSGKSYTSNINPIGMKPLEYLSFFEPAHLNKRLLFTDNRHSKDYEPCERCALRGTRCHHCRAIRTGGGYIIIDDSFSALDSSAEDGRSSSSRIRLGGVHGSHNHQRYGSSLISRDSDRSRNRGFTEFDSTENLDGENGYRSDTGRNGTGRGIAGDEDWENNLQGKDGRNTHGNYHGGGHNSGGKGLGGNSYGDGGGGVGDSSSMKGKSDTHSGGYDGDNDGVSRRGHSGVKSSDETNGSGSGDRLGGLLGKDSSADSRLTSDSPLDGMSGSGGRGNSSTQGQDEMGDGWNGKGKRQRHGRAELEKGKDKTKSVLPGQDNSKNGNLDPKAMNANNGDNSYKGYTTRKGEEDPDTPSSNSYGDLMRFKSKANKNVRAKSCTLRELKGIDPLDYLAKYCIIDQNKLPHYQKVFDNVDLDEDDEINVMELDFALKAVNYNLISDAELTYVNKVLELAGRYALNFRLFTLVAALSERIVSLDGMVRRLVNGMDFEALETKMKKCKELFYLLANQNDEDEGVVTASALAIELQAGGLTEEHVDYVIDHLEQKGVIEFLDYLVYVPLFLEIHGSISSNPLDFSRTK